MGSIDWTDVLKGATAFFLIIAGLGTAYVCVRLGGLFARLAKTVGEMTDEVVPILTRAQTTVDGINLELVRVDDIMVTAVNATKGAEKTVSSISGAVAAPVRKASGLAAMAKEALATFRTRRAAGPDEAEALARRVGDQPTGEIPVFSPEAEQADAFRQAAGAAGERFREAMAPVRAAADIATPATPRTPSPAPLGGDVFAKHVRANTAADTELPPFDSGATPTVHEHLDGDVEPLAANGAGGRRRGPSLSQISWALPKRGSRS